MKFSTRQLTYMGIMAALVFVATRFLGLPIPTGYGWMHLGDTFVYLSGALLGPLGAIPAGIGSMLSDITAGYAVYAIPTLLIKTLDAGILGYVAKHYLNPQDGFMLHILKLAMGATLGTALMMAGYFITEVLLYELPVAIANLVPNAIQGIGGAFIFLVIYPALTRVLSTSDII